MINKCNARILRHASDATMCLGTVWRNSVGKAGSPGGRTDQQADGSCERSLLETLRAASQPVSLPLHAPSKEEFSRRTRR